MLEIDKGVPLVPRNGPYKYPWDDMEIGDSVLITDVGDEVVRVSVYRANRTRAPRRWCSRKLQGGTRVWRIA